MIDNSILENAANSVLKGDKAAAEAIAHEVLEKGLDPVEVITKGYTAGIIQVGDLFERGRLFLPELILCADVMENATKILNDAMAKDATGAEVKKGKVLVATVEGDVHDIGKGIFCSMLSANGLEVIDMGRDIPVDKIIEKAEEVGADVIGTSSLLTTTMIHQKDLEEALIEKGIRDKYITAVGGAPVTIGWAERIGTDIYAETAVEGVNKILAAIEEKNSK